MSENPHIKNLFSAEEEDCLSLEQLKSYQAGNLVGAEKHYAERHLLNCELCGMAYEGIAELDADTVEAGAAAISGMAWDRVANQERRRRVGAWVWISAAASVALIVAVGFFALRGPSQEEKMKTLAEGLYEAPLPPAGDGKPSVATQQDSVVSGAIAANRMNELQGSENFQSGARFRDMNLSDEEEASVSPDEEQITNTGTVKDLSNMDKIEFAYNNAPVASGITATTTPVPPPPATAPKPEDNALERAKDRSESMDDDFDMSGEFDGVADGEIVVMDEMAEVVEEAEEKTVTIADNKRAEPRLDIVIEGGDIVAQSDVATKESATLSTVVVTSRSIQKSGRSARNRTKREQKARKKDKSKGKANTAKNQETMNESPGYYGGVKADSMATMSDYDLGLDAYRQGRYQESSDLLRKAAAATPSNLEAHYYAAASFMNIEQPQAAIYHLNRVLAVPGHALYADAEWYKALAYLKLNEKEKAKNLLEKIQEKGGKHAKPARKALNSL